MKHKELESMRHFITIAATAILFAAVVLPQRAGAEPNCKGAWSCCCGHCQRPWNAPYYSAEWGIPVAVVVPPTAEVQTHWGWGVGNTRVTPICARYKPNYLGQGAYNRCLYSPTPPWPSDTDQFGYYYVRGPW
jgi:hypothetical protein